MLEVAKGLPGSRSIKASVAHRFGRAVQIGSACRSATRGVLRRDHVAKVLLLLAAAGVLGLIWLIPSGLADQLTDRDTNTYGWTILQVVRLLAITNILVFVWRVWLFLGYRPAPSRSDNDLPTCTVVVPAYNEGRHVLKTLQSVLSSDFPVAKLQVIAVDDGSADDTREWIQRACTESNGRVEMIAFARNRGKRAAIYEAVRRSVGEVIVTIDSDSVIEPATLRNLVSPFVHDPAVGAVAGNVRVLNRKDGILPKMLDTMFYYAFDFIRAGQSTINSVLCTPGALSAYRKGAVEKNLDAWAKQTFLGAPAGIGEDRALTNVVLRNGFDVRFQSNAVVYTILPVQYRGLRRMLLRWARSNLREGWITLRFIFTRFRKRTAAAARVNFVASFLNPILTQFLLLAVADQVLAEPELYAVRVMLGATVLSTVRAVFYTLCRRSPGALWSYAYGLLWIFGLWWISFWAFVTIRNSNWMTRQLATTRTSTKGCSIGLQENSVI